MTRNVVALLVSVISTFAAARLLLLCGKRLKGKPIPFGATYGLVLLGLATAAGSFAAAIDASQWAIVGCLTIACGGVTLGFLASLAGRPAVGSADHQLTPSARP